MRGMRLVVAVVAMMLAVGCGGSDDGDDERSLESYGPAILTCSDWVGRLDDGERWDAAEELLIDAKGSDGTEGDKAPSTMVVRQFADDLGTMCERGNSDDFMATVADALYWSNRAFYRL